MGDIDPAAAVLQEDAGQEGGERQDHAGAADAGIPAVRVQQQQLAAAVQMIRPTGPGPPGPTDDRRAGRRSPHGERLLFIVYIFFFSSIPRRRETLTFFTRRTRRNGPTDQMS